MALMHPDKRWRSLMTALAAATALTGVEPVFTAGISREEILVNVKDGAEFDGVSRIMTMKQPVVTQGTTLLRATIATATNTENGFRNSTFRFDGSVHLEFDGAVVDAQAATAVFADGRLSSIDVRAVRGQQSGKPGRMEFNGAVVDVDTAVVSFNAGRINTIQAQGSPARFSHVLKKNQRRASGHASRIEYDAGKSMLSLSGDTWFSVDDFEYKDAAWVTYNLAEGSYKADSGSISQKRDERVPAPRTPDRTSAK